MRNLFGTLAGLTALMILLPFSSIAADIQLVPVVSGLSSPVFVGAAHDGTNRLFILEQGGVMKVLQPGASAPTVFLNITAKVLSGGEQGLLGLAFHPQYPSNPRFYLDYTRAGDGATVIAEYQVSTNPDVANPAENVLLVIPQPYTNHNGGMLAFGRDGYLYIGMGDGGSSFDPENRAQNINELLGKILRIDVDHPNGAVPYSSPSTNPFYGAIPGADEVYAYGLRNPWRFSFDRVTGDLYVADVGQNEREEVDIVTSGKNYGWRVWEGARCTGLSPDPTCSGTGYTFPVIEYSHTAGRCSITGGYVYRGTVGSLPLGSYVFGDYCTGEIFLVENSVFSILLDTPFNISSFGEDEAGEVYVVDLTGGAINRIANAVTPTCTYAIITSYPISQTFPAAGLTVNATVTTQSSCPWSAVAFNDWITINSGSTGQGNGSVTFSVAVNRSLAPRSGTINIADQSLQVRQDGVSGLVFLDVPLTYGFYDDIRAIFDAGVTNGCGAGMYCPQDTVTRGEMAAFVIRSIEHADRPPSYCSGGSPFADVPQDHAFCGDIKRLFELGITTGCSPGLFCIDAPVSRGQMAAFIIRSLYGENFSYTSAPYFTDVPPTHGFFKYVQKMKDVGLTMVAGTYFVDRETTRGEMAAFLKRAFISATGAGFTVTPLSTTATTVTTAAEQA